MLTIEERRIAAWIRGYFHNSHLNCSDAVLLKFFDGTLMYQRAKLAVAFTDLKNAYIRWQYETCDNYAETLIRSTTVIIKYFLGREFYE